eukprot:scaffold38786_cov31-Tisochrysis_lutea.AAC.2
MADRFPTGEAAERALHPCRRAKHCGGSLRWRECINELKDCATRPRPDFASQAQLYALWRHGERGGRGDERRGRLFAEARHRAQTISMIRRHNRVLRRVGERFGRNELESAELKFLDTVPCNGFALTSIRIAEEVIAIVERAICHGMSQAGVASLGHIRLEDEYDGLPHFNGGGEFA